MKNLKGLIDVTVAHTSSTLTDYLAPGLKKIPHLALGLALGVSLFAGNTPEAKADVLGGVVAATSLAGIFGNGNYPHECDGLQNLPGFQQIQGTNGWTNAGAGAAGAALGNQLGGGKGKNWLTLIGGLGAANAASNMQQEQIAAKCNALRQQAIAQGLIQGNNPQGNNQFAAMNTPRPPTRPGEYILYQTTTDSGSPLYMTMESSPGIQAMNGLRSYSIEISQLSPEAQNAIMERMNGLNNSYQKLDSVGKAYVNMANGNSQYQDAYITNTANRVSLQEKMKVALKEFEVDYNKYVEQRSITALLLDELAVRGVNLTGLKQYAYEFQAPQSAIVTYGTAYQKALDNRFATNLPRASNLVKN